MTRRIIALAMASFTLGIMIWAIARPWGPWLGYSYSIQRIVLCYIIVSLTIFIPGLLCSLTYEGIRNGARKYYIMTASASAAAIYALGGLPTGVNIDLPALITSFSAVYFGPMVCLIAFSIGFIVRWFIGGAPWLNIPILIPLISMIDGGVWALNSVLYRYITSCFKDSKLSFVIAVLVMIAVHMFACFIVFAATIHPWPASIAYIMFSLTTWYPTTIVFIIIGSVVGRIMSSLYPPGRFQ